MNIKRISNWLFAACVFAILNSASHAAIIELFTENMDAFNAFQELGDGATFGAQIVPEGSSPFSDGNALRMFDFTDEEKPELQGELSAPLLEPFRIDFQSSNQSPVSSSSAIRFRMGNSGQNVTSENRAAFSLSWQADKKLSAKYSGGSDSNPNDVDTTNSSALEGVTNITMIANGALAGTYSYSLFGESRTLNPLSYDVYIDGELLNDSSPGDAKHDEFKNGMLFHNAFSTNYDETLGIQRFGLFGSSDANTDPDVYYDNIILRTGVNIPEPGLLSLVFGGALFMSLRRWR